MTDSELLLKIMDIVNKYIPKKYNFNVYVNEQERLALLNDIIDLTRELKTKQQD